MQPESHSQVLSIKQYQTTDWGKADRQEKAMVIRQYANSTPVVHKVLIQILEFFKTTKIEDEMLLSDDEKLNLKDIHHIFQSGKENEIKAIITTLFWFFLYKDRGNYIYSAVHFDPSLDAYILLKECYDKKPNICAFGFDTKYLAFLYSEINQKTQNLDTHTPQYFNTVLGAITDFFSLFNLNNFEINPLYEHLYPTTIQ